MKYICQICKRKVDEKIALVHVKTEEYLIDLIRKDHPQWHEAKATCKKCVQYYRKLIKDAQI